MAPYTTEGDVVVDPSGLRDNPTLGELLHGAGFYADTQHVGTRVMSRLFEGRPVEVKIDLMVPQAVGGPGCRCPGRGGAARTIARRGARR